MEGTALALQIGHRKSIDLDFFGHIEIEPIELIEELKAFGPVITRSANRRIQRYMVCNIQIDFAQKRESDTRNLIKTLEIELNKK